jgi:Type III restriction enzyme, res subunit/Helicase C-terminal domain
MVKFRTSSSEESKPESIVLMFRDLNRDSSVKYLWSHQDKILEEYYQKYLQSKDLAIELPTGSGKTLVGLLTAEYRRRALKERIVFLCPTRQLCAQVNEQARRYGIKTALLVGSQGKYDTTSFYEYQQGKAIAVTTYSGVFNTNPRISDPEVIICDDAHAADNYISDLWTLSISRVDHQLLYMSIYRLLESVMPPHMAYKIETNGKSRIEFSVDSLSTIASHGYLTQLSKILEDSIPDDLRYSWSILSSYLEACSLYLSAKNIEIRPLVPPAQTHKPFSDAKQRIYMSATLGEDGDIERVFGIKEIDRLPIPEEWHKRSTGRRLILFPSLSVTKNPIDIAVSMVQKQNRSLILVPDKNRLQTWKEKLPKTHEIIGSEQIEHNLDAFTKSSKPSILLLASRYDGIDLPGDDCRFMILDSEPSASGLQELYLRTGLGASSQLQNRIRTRVTQALGRCTRDESDFSVVLILGDKLTQRCCTRTLTQGMHPEIQAEIEFGLENSTDRAPEDFIELSDLFLSRSSDWLVAEQDIRKKRDLAVRLPDATTEALKKAMPHEINYVYASWKGQHEDALNMATKILAALEGGVDLKPYRAFWFHQAAISAFLSWKHSTNETFKATAISYLSKASETSSNITWLGKLRSQLSGSSEISNDEFLPVQEWFLKIDDVLQRWKIVGSNYSKQVSDVDSNIQNRKAKFFEKGLTVLGEMLGARTHQWNDDAAPDGLWIFGNWQAFVFEAKTNESSEGGISIDTVRQALTHEQRVRVDNLIPEFVPCSTIVISPRTMLHKLAFPHADNITYMSHDEVIKMFNDVALALERLRSSACGSTDEALCENAMKFYSEKMVDLENIKNRLLKRKLRDLPLQPERVKRDQPSS